jgi:putative ABC transport system substrate-binding protein
MKQVMRRRRFVGLLGCAASLAPQGASAQQPPMPAIGFLSTRGRGEDEHLLAAFRQGLQQSGYVEHQNVTIEYYFADNEYDRLAALVADLVRKQVNVIVAPGGPSAAAAKTATRTIPIVFSVGADPVEVGLVASLNRPGGNATGVTNLGVEVAPKRLELLHELVPKAALIAALVNPGTSAAETQLRDIETSARTLGRQVHVLEASTERDLDAVFANLVRLRAGGLVIGNDAFFSSRVEQLAALALRHGYQRSTSIASLPLPAD